MTIRNVVLRKHHRFLSMIVLLPVSLIVLTGILAPILELFHFERAAAFVRQVHSGKLFLGSAYPIYAVSSGLGLLGLLITGLGIFRLSHR